MRRKYLFLTWLKKPSHKKLTLLVSLACALSPVRGAVAHLRLAHPPTQAIACNPNLQIESVKYLGHGNGKDSVQVVFVTLLPTASFGGGNLNNNGGPVAGFNNTLGTSCATYGVPLVNPNFQGGPFSNPSPQQNFGGNAANQGFGYELKVTITRRLGHQDTGTAKSSNIFNGEITTIVQIPRETLETDPVAYDVTFNTTFGGTMRRILTAQGNGAPSLAAATQTFANFNLAQSSQQSFGGNTTPDNCFPSVSITGLSFTQGSGATPDAVTIAWTASNSPSNCFNGPKVFISVEVKRPDNSTGRGSTQPNANSITVNLSGASAASVSFIVRVSAETSLGKQFQVNQKGEF